MSGTENLGSSGAEAAGASGAGDLGASGAENLGIAGAENLGISGAAKLNTGSGAGSAFGTGALLDSCAAHRAPIGELTTQPAALSGEPTKALAFHNALSLAHRGVPAL